MSFTLTLITSFCLSVIAFPLLFHIKSYFILKEDVLGCYMIYYFLSGYYCIDFLLLNCNYFSNTFILGTIVGFTEGVLYFSLFYSFCFMTSLSTFICLPLSFSF